MNPSHSLTDSGSGIAIAKLLRYGLMTSCLGLALGYGLGSGIVPKALSDVFTIIAESQYRNYMATSNIAADGKSEYLVWLADEPAAGPALQDFLRFRNDWEMRESGLPGWVVLRVPQSTLTAKTLLQEQSFARAVLKNRGIWLCH